jgi:SulP family sulfate permease
VSGFSGDERSQALFALTVLAGLVMLAAALLRLGRYTRFVSVSVLTGFLTGVAVNIVCGQLGDLLGAPAEGPFALAKAIDVLTHPSAISGASAAVGLLALALLVGLGRTRWATSSAIVALVVPTALAALLGGVTSVEDEGAIPTGLPVPQLPDFALMLDGDVLAGALAIAVIVLVQGTGVAEVAPNLDGSRSDADRDFLAQGVANVASGLLRGQPVGGSVGQTALNLAAGARDRWAAICSGLWMALIVVALAGVVGKVAIPTLAAVLIYAAAGSLRLTRIDTIARTGWGSRAAFVVTLGATLVLPIATAVGIGVALSLILQLVREADDLRVVRLVAQPGGGLAEAAPPPSLPGGEVTVLDVYGSLRFAGARTLEERLPDPQGARRPAVVLRLRGREQLGATALIVLEHYAERVGAAGGHLFLSGVGPELAEHLRRTRRVDLERRVTLLEATPLLGASTEAAITAAEAWLRGPEGGSPDPVEAEPPGA